MSEYDKYKLTDNEIYILKEATTGGKNVFFCPTCGMMVSAKALRKKPEDGILHSECLICFIRRDKEVDK